MKLTTIQSGIMHNNTYILTDNGHGVIIDPGMNNTKLVDFINADKTIKYNYIIITHAHFDHVRMAGQIKELTGALIAIHSAEKEWVEYELEKTKTPMSPDVLLENYDVLTVEGMKLEILHTPGHSPGGICIICDNCLFTGDTLFKGTVGRCDFEYGDFDAILKSIDTLSKLKGNYIVYPGHDDSTTLDEERATNPYFK